MKVELNGTLPDTGAASGWVVLCENADAVKGIALDAPSKSTSRMIQTSAPARATFTTEYYRGLRRNTRTFRVASSFTSLTDASDFVELQEPKIPHTAILRITSTPDGQGVKVRTYENCQLHSIVCEPGGRTVLIDYLLSFGRRLT